VQVSGFPADEPAIQAVDGFVLQVFVTIQHDVAGAYKVEYRVQK